ncbi:unnamed protein product (macronuclear) [Paramecium tetraurelia]|uniref:Uncharacterized protein n=1 Tax=Paramecium tetraurelia TaxID=5888 RepID=A0BWY2_PARTE|nr:uncharacterized protein GSPATT00032901001 [Paramecium tetraurelia]CAK63049.1 unnamed protein product [Paramecium tetraurelia]|eukprot:XP_001430447.1 hypothetical protein (macronuclear) [Paramecium tetraurelia strain d4-2]
MQISENHYLLKRQDTQDQKFNSQFSSPETDYRLTQKDIIPFKSQEDFEKETQQLQFFTPKKIRYQEKEIYYTPENKKKQVHHAEIEDRKFKQIGNILFFIQIIIIILLEVMN